MAKERKSSVTGAAGGWVGRWAHGRIRQEKDGRLHYYIEARRDGRYHLKPTGVYSAGEAAGEFSRFEDDPAGYRSKEERKANPGGGPAPIYLDDALATEFLDFGRDVQKLTAAWLAKKKRYLAWWTDHLWKMNLRGLDVAVIVACVPKGRTPSRPHKVATLKALYEYLRNPEQRMAYKPGLPTLKAAEDPMLDFPVPQGAPAQSKGSKDSKKAPIPKPHLSRVLLSLKGTYRDALIMLAGTGWRGTEIPRFAAEGELRDADADEQKEGVVGELGVFSIKRAQRKWKKVLIKDERVLAAAKRLKEHGSFDIARLDKAIRKACTDAEIPPFGYGRVRHTVAGYAKEKRARVDLIAEAIGNTADVARRHYQQLAPAAPIPTPLEAIDLA